jgi:hypothetical protein
MTVKSRPGLNPALALAGVGCVLALLGGCQTWTSGMTLPSERYLQHPPQYFPPSPPFPLPKELSAQEAVAATPTVPGGAVVPPPPLPPVAPPPGGPPPLPPPLP